MDIAALSQAVVTALAPFLVRMSQKGAETLGSKAGEAASSAGSAIWQRIFSRISPISPVMREAQRVAAGESAEEPLRAAIMELLQNDEALRGELASLLEIRSGNRNVRVTGSYVEQANNSTFNNNFAVPDGTVAADDD